MKYLLSLIVIPLLLISCGSDNPEHQEQEKLWDEMMVIHDDVMPKMGQINKLSRTLRKHLKNNKETIAENEVQKIEASVKLLTDAHDGMMEWMNVNGGFTKLRSVRADKDHAGVLKYIEKETASIENVKKMMLESIKSGEALKNELNL